VVRLRACRTEARNTGARNGITIGDVDSRAGDGAQRVRAAAASDQGVDGIPRISCVGECGFAFLGDRARGGMEGRAAEASFLFYDLRTGRASDRTTCCSRESAIRRRRFARPDVPDHGDDRMNLHGCCCRKCGSSGGVHGSFPATLAHRTEGIDGERAESIRDISSADIRRVWRADRVF